MTLNGTKLLFRGEEEHTQYKKFHLWTFNLNILFKDVKI